MDQITHITAQVTPEALNFFDEIMRKGDEKRKAREAVEAAEKVEENK